MATDSIVKQNNEVTANSIQSLIVRLPGRPAAMLAKDLAEIYETTTSAINQAVERNPDRFPDDFMFQANRDETKVLISQAVISKESALKTTPHLFTQMGANMLSSVLRSDIAIQRSIQIMRAFTQLEQSLYNLPAERKEAFELHLIGLKYCSEIMNYSDNKKLQMIRAAHKYHGVSSDFLPEEGISAKPEEIRPVKLEEKLPTKEGKYRLALSSGALLKKKKLPISVVAFNELLVKKGLLDISIRERSGRHIALKVLTSKGLEYGFNHPSNNIPNYYEDVFMNLYNLVTK